MLGCWSTWKKRGDATRIGDDRGSVLLEAILVIPLYAVLLGGIMWVGDLVLARERLVISDRYAAWNIGNRNSPKTLGSLRSKIQKIFFDPGHEGYERIDGAEGGTAKPRRWWEERYARITLTVETPLWTRPWLSFGDIFWGARLQEKFTGADGRGPLTGGGTPYFKDGNMVLMRTEYSDRSMYFRNWEGKDLANPVMRQWFWREIEPEPWPPDSGQVPVPPRMGFEYRRYGQYDSWSI